MRSDAQHRDRSARRSIPGRAALLVAATLAMVVVLVPLGRASDAGTAALSGGQYSAFVVAGSGSSMAALDAGSLGGVESSVAAPTNDVINMVAIDPRAEEVLATFGPANGSGSSGVVAYSARTGQEIGVVALDLVDAGSVTISPDGTTAWIGDWRSRQIVSLALSGTAVPTLGSAALSVPPLSSQANSPVVCALALSPDGSQLYAGVSDYNARFVEDTPLPAAPCGPTKTASGFPSTAALYGYGVGGAGGPAPTPLWADAPLFHAPVAFLAAAVVPEGSISALRVAPDGTALYVAVREQATPGAVSTSGLVLRLTGLPGTPTPPAAIFPQSPSLSDPVDLALTPDGSSLYIADDAGNRDLYQLGLPGLGPARAIPGVSATALAVTPDGAAVVVATSASTLASVPISPAAPLPATLGPTVPLATPTALAVTPDQAPVASLTGGAANPGVPVTLDAAASTVVYGSITTYAWDFGDGGTATTVTPVVTHTYVSAGSYVATVTETDGAGTSIPPGFASFPVDFTGQTASKRADASARASTPVAITNPPPTTPAPTVPSTPAPPPPTTSHPTPPTTRPTTTPTVPHGSSTTGLTTPTTRPPPPPGSPTLTVDPVLGPPGAVISFSGRHFPPDAAVTVAWLPGIGSAVVTSDAAGRLSGSILVMYRDQIGSRVLAAVGYPTAVASFLVVPGAAEPAGSSAQFLFRR